VRLHRREREAFFVPAVRLGIVSDRHREVLRRAGSQAAALLFLLGERMPAPRAREYGLITEVVPDGGALARSCALIEVSTQGVPDAVAGTKRLLRELRGEGAG
jgi:enoyl-CoA hydratase/carnithine racemase